MPKRVSFQPIDRPALVDDTGEDHPRAGDATYAVCSSWAATATFYIVVTNPSLDLVLEPVLPDTRLTAGQAQPPRPLGEWLTTFHLASVVLDPFTNESSWILQTAARILRAFSGSAARANFILTCSGDEARQFLGPLGREFLVFADADRSVVRGLGLAALPAFVFIRSDGSVAAVAEGWNPLEWRAVAKDIASTTAWTAPAIPLTGDPAAFAGTPALG